MGNYRLKSGHMKGRVYSPHGRWWPESYCGGLMILIMLNGPMKRGATFLVPPRIGMSSVESNHCPTQYIGVGILLLSASCFIRAADLMRLECVTLQVLLHHLANTFADGTPTALKWGHFGSHGSVAVDRILCPG